MNDPGTCWHEAGHQATAKECGLILRGVTVIPGEHAAGCSLTRFRPLPAGTVSLVRLEAPFTTWPEATRTRIEHEALVAAAGEAARLLLTPRDPAPVRLPEPLTERALELAAELPPTEDETAVLSAAVSDPDGESDEASLARLARLAHGGDLASMAAWLRYIEAQAERLVMLRRDAIERLAGLLAIEGTVGGEAAARMLDDLR